MKIELDKRTRAIFRDIHDLFSKNNHEIRLAGGAVRDILMNETPDDLDFCTTCLPDDMMKMNGIDNWEVLPTGLQHGTVTFVKKIGFDHPRSDDHILFEKIAIEVTTLRKDVDCDGRWADVEFTNDWKTDAERRDFTINAMMLDIDGNVYDYFNGLEDIKTFNVRFVGCAEKRIQEDALRMLRFIRFWCRTHNKKHLDKASFSAIQNNVDLIRNISNERIWSEFEKACKKSSEYIPEYFKLLDHSGLSCAMQFPTYDDAIWDLPADVTKNYPSFAFATQLIRFHDAQERADEFYKKYKPSMKQRKEINFFLMCSRREFTYDFIEDLLEMNYDRDLIVSYAKFIDDKALIHCAKTLRQPILPLTAKILLEKYDTLEEGKKLGMLLKSLKDDWKDSRYTMSQHELLELAESRIDDTTL